MIKKIVEIDDNNNSNVFKELGVESVSVTTDKSDEAFGEAMLEQCRGDIDRLIVDAGGGNDTKKVLNSISDMKDEFLFIIPIGKSMSQLKNAIDTYELINLPDNTVFCLNNVSDISKVEDEFLFWYGSKELGIKKSKYIDAPTLLLEYTPFFEIAASKGLTISQLAELYQLFGNNPYKAIIEATDEKEEQSRLMEQWRMAKFAHNYLENNLEQFKNLTDNFDKICVCNTKGGVGKSTISWQILTAI